MTKDRLFKILHLLIAVALLSYVVTRVFTIPITTDEVWTYYAFVKAQVWDIMTAYNPVANNHILNTLLSKFTTLFSDTLFFLRLPNVLAFIIYMYAAHKLSVLYCTNKTLRLTMFLAMLTNFTLLAFFGICRGYGISIALLTLSVYHLVEIYNQADFKKKHLHYTLLAATLAVYASFTIAYAAVTIFALAAYASFTRHRLKGLIAPISYGILGIILCAYPLYRTYKAEELYFGGTKGFFDDTLTTFLERYIGGYFFANNSHVIVVIAVFIVAGLLGVALNYYNKKLLKYFIPAILLTSCIIIINVLFRTASIRLPIVRTSLYLFPLMILTIWGCLAVLHTKFKIVSIAIALAICSFGTWRFAENMNTTEFAAWWHDMHTKQVLNLITENANEAKPSIYIFKDAYHSFRYHCEKEYHSSVSFCEYYGDLTNMPDTVKSQYIFVNKFEDLSAMQEYQRVRAYHPDSFFVLYVDTTIKK